MLTLLTKKRPINWNFRLKLRSAFARFKFQAINKFDPISSENIPSSGMPFNTNSRSIIRYSISSAKIWFAFDGLIVNFRRTEWTKFVFVEYCINRLITMLVLGIFSISLLKQSVNWCHLSRTQFHNWRWKEISFKANMNKRRYGLKLQPID